MATLEDRLKTLEDLDDRVDAHDSDIEAIRSEMRGMRRELGLLRADMNRVLDSQTSNGLVLDRVARLMESLVVKCGATIVCDPP
jgi:chromosome segregation ATPase